MLKFDHSKLDPKALKCVFLGYLATQKNYKCYHLASRKKFISMDVMFFESTPVFYSSKTSLQGQCCNEELSLQFVPVLMP